MTVAAVVLAETTGDALRPAGGVSAARQVADTAWAGGALPIVVVAPDPEGALAASLARSEADVISPSDERLPPGAEHGQDTARDGHPLLRGARAALARVGETTAVLAWPVQMAWVDAATVTALLEAHAAAPDTLIRPTWKGTLGWPVLVPLTLLLDRPDLAALPHPAALLDALERGGARVRTLDLGDPGVALSTDTARAALPPFEGPDQPVTGHPPDWGADVARVAPER